MRRPEWQSHLVAAALSVGCGAAAPADAVDTAPTTEAAEVRPEREADARPPGDQGRARGDCAGAKASCEDGDAPEPKREREARRDPARARGRGDRVAKHARKGGKSGDQRSAPGQGDGGNSGAPAQSGAGNSAPTGGELVDRLFFARGSADLALHGHALDAIAKVVRAGEPVTVIIVGGADEREPAALARTRARAVRDALLARGVPGSWIVLALDQPGPGPASYDQRVDVRMQEP